MYHILNRIWIIVKNFFLLISTLMIPKSRNLIVIGGWGGRRFADNTRYLYLQNLSSDHPLKMVWITSDEKIYKELKANQMPVIKKGTLSSIWFHLRAKYHVIDAGPSDIDGAFSVHAIRIQLFHGFPIKNIWHGIQQRSSLKNLIEEFQYRHPFFFFRGYTNVGGWDKCKLLTPSPLFSDTFQTLQMNKKNEHLHYQYPRVEYLKQKGTGFLLHSESEFIQLLIKEKKEGYVHISYLPTFREHSENLLFGTHDQIKQQEFLYRLLKMKIKIIMKPHLADKDIHSFPSDMHILPSFFDVYPFLKYSDALITDYSSVMFDFLVLDRPIFYFIHDFKNYKDNERGFAIDYNEFTLGRKSFSIEELYSDIENVIYYKNDCDSVQRNSLAKRIYTNDYPSMIEYFKRGDAI